LHCFRFEGEAVVQPFQWLNTPTVEVSTFPINVGKFASFGGTSLRHGPGSVADMHTCPRKVYRGKSSDLVGWFRDPRRPFQPWRGVPDPTGVFAPGVAESVPAFFFFFFFRGINAGGFMTALRSDRYEPQVRQRLSGRSGLQKTVRD
jgi:hypothetical protein